MNGGIGRDAALRRPVGAARQPYLNVRWLGRMDFARALELQEELVAKKREDASLEDQLLLLEHEPVYTIGRTPDRSSLSATGSRPSRDGEFGSDHLPHPLFSINRGGQATYHGPGQLMGYPIIDSAAMRPGFAQIFALARATAHRSSRPIRHCRAATRIAHRSLGRKSQDRFDRRRRSPLDHHARVRAERVRRSLAF